MGLKKSNNIHSYAKLIIQAQKAWFFYRYQDAEQTILLL